MVNETYSPTGWDEGTKHYTKRYFATARNVASSTGSRPSGASSPILTNLGRLVGRSRYFVVTPPDIDNPSRTGGYSPLVMRYLEGLAAGTRLLGVLPRSGEFEQLLPRDSICEVDPCGSDLAEKLDADRHNRQRMAGR